MMISMTKHIVSFSGGKDSTALLLRMLEEGMQIDEIVFCNTQLEFPAMYEHIDRVERYVDRKITRISSKHSFEYYMFDYIKKKGKGKGSRGRSWPDYRIRWCTGELKRDVMNRYLKRYSHPIEYHGITIDEIQRTESNLERNIKYPLVEWGMTDKDCLQYCYSKGFDWDGLYEKFDRVSCYLCPLQRLSELRVLYKEFPDLWAYMKELDNRNIKQFGRQFKADYSIEDLEQRFIEEDRQLCFDFAMGG